MQMFKLFNKGIESVIDATIDADYIDSSVLNIPAILEIDQDPDNPKVSWLSGPISWFGLDKFNGAIIMKVKKLDNSFLPLENLHINIGLRDKTLFIDSLTANAGTGTLEANANIGMEINSAMFLSFSMNNFPVSTMMNYVFNIDAMNQGNFSCVGTMKSQGNSINQLIRAANGKMEIAARGINLRGFAIDLLFDKVLDVKSERELLNLTKVSIFSRSDGTKYSGFTNIEYLNGAANISNGVVASALRFKTLRSTGVFSSNLSLMNFHNKSIVKFFFMNKRNNAEVLSIDMNIGGPIWLPRISFDNKKLYDLVLEKRLPNSNK